MSRRTALLAVWLPISIVLAAPVALSVIAPAWLTALAGALQLPHHACPLCGMTRAYLACAAGDLAAAHTLNAAAPPLYLGSAGNALLAGAVTLRSRLRRSA